MSLCNDLAAGDEPNPTLIMEEMRLCIRNLKTGEIVRVSNPLPDGHWPFRMPAAEATVWRYGDYRKFDGLFREKKSYFRRADKLADEFEGRFTQGNQDGLSRLFGDAIKQLGLGRDGIGKIHEIQESHRSHIFLQCWHQNISESAEMWKEYTTGPESIVLRTTVGLLGRAVGGECHGLSVEYIDESFAIPEMHSLAPIAYKRKKFEFEREFRVALVLKPEEPVFLDRPEDFFRLIAAHPGAFVQEVRFHPHATATFKDLVREELQQLWHIFSIGDSQS
jgi:hypothetical protein